MPSWINTDRESITPENYQRIADKVFVSKSGGWHVAKDRFTIFMDTVYEDMGYRPTLLESLLSVFRKK